MAWWLFRLQRPLTETFKVVCNALSVEATCQCSFQIKENLLGKWGLNFLSFRWGWLTWSNLTFSMPASMRIIKKKFPRSSQFLLLLVQMRLSKTANNSVYRVIEFQKNGKRFTAFCFLQFLKFLGAIWMESIKLRPRNRFWGFKKLAVLVSQISPCYP